MTNAIEPAPRKTRARKRSEDGLIEVIALVRMNRDDGTDEMCAVGETIKKSRDAAIVLQDAGKIKVKI
jgi:hypothetical protein